jgi:DNA invertase Pin-like site-specific DNA recombinase
MAALLGYARVSTGVQELALQHDALNAVGCLRIFDDTASGALDDRPQLAELLDHLREGDTLVVWRLDRLGRSLRHLIDTVTALADRGVGFRSLQESIDTTTPGGRLVFHVFAALAEFERDLISERTRAGLAAARARGRKGGRRTVMTPAKLAVAREMYDSRKHTTAVIAAVVGVSRATLYRALTPSSQPAPSSTSDAVQPPPAPVPRRPIFVDEVDKESGGENAAAIASKAAPPSAPARSGATTRRTRAARRVELPSVEAALGRQCPRCGAAPKVMCRDTRSRAKRKPAAEKVHFARHWLDRSCPACRAAHGEPCRSPSGAQATNIHAARLRPSKAEHDARALASQVRVTLP